MDNLERPALPVGYAHKALRKMKILGIETSCDETAAAVVQDGTKLLSNAISSSVALQQKYGGVVPEVAAREQLKVIIPVIEEALGKARIELPQIDAIAVTSGPGLIGSLLVGVETAKILSLIFEKPLIPVNHLMGHVYANWIGQKPPEFPLIALIVSGGHTDLIYMEGHRKYKWLGGTRDDAAGEAFDKVARLLNLAYPGGPEIERVGKSGNPNAYNFPRPMIDSQDFDFSFSGSKTAVVNIVRNHNQNTKKRTADLAASFQKAVVEVLVVKTLRAAKKYGVGEIVVGGGVAANKLLREELTGQSSVKIRFPSVELSVDNAAMIAAAAYFNFKPGKIERIQAQPGLYF